MKLQTNRLKDAILAYGSFLVCFSALAKAPELIKIADLPSPVTIAGPLLFMPKGEIYGTSITGGKHQDGFVYVIRADGTTATLVDFDHKTCGAYPTGKLVEHPDGGILGTTLDGGEWQLGTIYHISENGNFRTLYSFRLGGPEHPETGLFIAPWEPNPILGTANDAGKFGFGVLFEINIKGQMARIAKLPRDPSAVVVESEQKRIYGLSAHGGTLTVGNSHFGMGSVFRYIPGLDYDAILPIRARGGDSVTSFRHIYRQWPVMTSNKSLIFSTFQGGKWGEGELVVLNADKHATTIRAFHLNEALSASIGSMAVDSDDVVYGVLDKTFTYDANNRKIELPFGAVCRIAPSGAPQLVYALNNGGPGQALQWRSNALYGVDAKALYRLVLNSPNK